MRRRAAKARGGAPLWPIRRRARRTRAALGERRPRAAVGDVGAAPADHYALAEQWVGPGAVWRRTATTISSGRTSAASGRPRSRTPRPGPGSRFDCSPPRWSDCGCAASATNGAASCSISPCSAATGRHAGAGSLPALVGRGHARPRRRTGILPEEHRPVVFDNKNPPSVPTSSSTVAWRGVALRRRADRARALRAAVAAGAPESYAPRNRLAAFMNGGG